ncbi:dolichyl-phosphate beta-glucosyltransferase [Deinococcus yavapaiensis]|uniref:dolichyl-phosphate beta-glucosyltransferase n=1 Tax=Deinococcus yavapaiensis KR-236 TaxID=694435 RepID=A0A318SCZ6_9DEIO|nr:dolichyl-phosphate beta-glucosyltransferase [Deinococcus yavapaiensis]PYE49897.1 dolichyl-phosphate beta-glucosyltransferase [Deinococcus yavapaiensis KR-236]
MAYSDFLTWRDNDLDPVDLSIVIPTYNESERILPTLGAMAVIVSGLGYRWELIVSDDGSKDGTADLVESLGWKNLLVVRHANTGKGGAVRRGVLAARGGRVLFADADNSTPIEELPRLMQQLDAGYDLAVGSRVGEGASEENKSAARKLVSGSLRLVTRVLSGVTVRDTQCGFKLFGPRSRRLFELQKMQGFSFDLELLYLAHKLGLRVAEVPVRWFDAPGSKVNSVQDSVKFLKDIFAVRRLDQQGAYEGKL